ncbi:hypothetical protein BH18CHL2_BH18CHL2_10630 [soil metagenome]
MQLYFYEIHEGDDETGSAVLLMHERRIEPPDFFALVKKARTLVKDAFEEDSLSEAIANELQRAHHFVNVTDEKLIASVAVDERDEDTFLVQHDERTRSVYVSGDDDSLLG